MEGVHGMEAQEGLAVVQRSTLGLGSGYMGLVVLPFFGAVRWYVYQVALPPSWKVRLETDVSDVIYSSLSVTFWPPTLFSLIFFSSTVPI